MMQRISLTLMVDLEKGVAPEQENIQPGRTLLNVIEKGTGRMILSVMVADDISVHQTNVEVES